jgi:hypothetical protein
MEEFGFGVAGSGFSEDVVADVVVVMLLFRCCLVLAGFV